MTNIISIIVSIVMLYVLYYLFDNYTLGTGIIANIVYGVVVSIINNGFNLLSIVLGIIVITIETLILYKIYNKSNSFGQFLVLTLIVALVIIIILGIISFVISSIMGTNGILSNR